MKKGFRNFCNGESSTSTLDQQNSHLKQNPFANLFPSRETHQPTLEEMFSKLGMEDKIGSGFQQHRRSCHNGSDILRRATNPLINQYPRFSLDGKEAMYQSSFTTMDPIRAGKSIHYDVEAEKTPRSLLPCMIGGRETVIWSKPGVVPKLMGLDVMPIPLKNISRTRESLNALIRKKNLRKRAERYEKERRELMADKRRSEVVESCSKTECTHIKPMDLEIPNGEAGWPIRHFL